MILKESRGLGDNSSPVTGLEVENSKILSQDEREVHVSYYRDHSAEFEFASSGQSVSN